MDDPAYLLRFFASVRRVGVIENGAGIDNAEESGPIWIATRPKPPVDRLWDALRHTTDGTVMVRRAMRNQEARPHQRRPSLTTYIELRLGKGSRTQLNNWFTRTWGSASFAEFWLYFNPVYGYALSYFVYRPLRRVLPRYVAAWLTFVASGLSLHDLVGWALGRHIRFPEMTLLFALFGLGAVASSAARMDLRRLPFAPRAGANLGYLAACFGAVQALR